VIASRSRTADASSVSAPSGISASVEPDVGADRHQKEINMRLLRPKDGSKLHRLAAIVLVAAVVLIAGFMSSSPAQAAPRDNLANARLCLHDGWKTLKTSNGRAFRNLGSCVVYALFGGQFAPPPSPGGSGE
jgi:hypothetical protein